jgi:hypothetical protein
VNTHDDGDSADMESHDSTREPPASEKTDENGGSDAPHLEAKPSGFLKAAFYWALSRL